MSHDAKTECPMKPQLAVAPATMSEDVFEGGFEGPEKTLEIDVTTRAGDRSGLRALCRAQIDELLDHAQCKVLVSGGNAHFDAYVLSESSLFVFPNKILIKTCGTTTLLRIIPSLLEMLPLLGAEVEWVGYSRKEFKYPEAQLFPHGDFSEETEYLQTYFKSGQPLLLGPLHSDRRYSFVADYCTDRAGRAGQAGQAGSVLNAASLATEGNLAELEVKTVASQPEERAAERGAERDGQAERGTLNIMMYDMAEDVAATFFATEGRTAEEVSRSTGIRDLLPGAVIQEWLFEPCGYSMNGLLDDSYSTIHITPEKEFSYVSFETNVRLPSYDALVRKVLSIFRPQRFTVTFSAHRGGLDRLQDKPCDPATLVTATNAAGDVARTVYHRSGAFATSFHGDYEVQMANYQAAPTKGLYAAGGGGRPVVSECNSELSNELSLELSAGSSSSEPESPTSDDSPDECKGEEYKDEFKHTMQQHTITA